jgi:hypothetical protein
MPTNPELLQGALLSKAAYADLTFNMTSFDYVEALKEAGMTNQEAIDFKDKYTVITRKDHIT